jgi:hypothetical protein
VRRGGGREVAERRERGGEAGRQQRRKERKAAPGGEVEEEGIRVSGVNIYKHHDECRPSDREFDSSQRPRCWWADVKVGRFKVGLCVLTFSFFFFFYCTIVK